MFQHKSAWGGKFICTAVAVGGGGKEAYTYVTTGLGAVKASSAFFAGVGDSVQSASFTVFLLVSFGPTLLRVKAFFESTKSTTRKRSFASNNCSGRREDAQWYYSCRSISNNKTPTKLVNTANKGDSLECLDVITI